MKISRILILLSSFLTFYAYFFDNSYLLYASLLFWVSFGIFFKDLKGKKLLLWLLFLGFISLGVSFVYGFSMDIKKLLSINQYLLVLLVCVGFLRLIAIPKEENSHKLPVGKGAFLKTYFGIHLFGSVINLSSLIIVADRLSKIKKLDKMQIITLTRSFASDAFWSPFFVAFGAAITYAPNLSLSTVLVNGLALALFSFLFTYKEFKGKKHNLKAFQGYPISFETLYIPVLLAILAIVTNYFFKDLKIIVLISIYSLFLVVVILPIKKGLKGGFEHFLLHVTDELPNMKSEISLFLVAGFFGMAISFLLAGFGASLPFEVFDWRVASLLLVLFLALGFIGIHPIITLAMIGDLLYNANNTLLAVSFLIAWSLNVSASPFSGLNLTISARYGVNSVEVLKSNLPYTIFMLFVGFCSLYILD